MTGTSTAAGAGVGAAILLVDDNAAKRLAMRAMLAPLGHVVVEAESGRAALRAVLDQSFAVILMDVRMPTMDGFETARLIRRRPRSERTPCIFVTAFGGDEAETAAAYEAGAVDFIFTPVNPAVLRAKVSAFVDLFAQSESLQRSLDAVSSLNAALRDSEVRARAVLENVADGIVTAGDAGLIESFNRSAQNLFGYAEAEVVGQPLQLIVAPSHHDDLSAAARARWSLLASEQVPGQSVETVGCHKDGTCFPMELDMSQMQIGERTHTIGCIRDISGRKAYTEALEHRSLHDELTGLANRTLFTDRLDRATAAAGRAGRSCGVLVLDLDGFAEVNVAIGRENGNVLLQAVAERLRGAMRESDTVARLSGDTFAILPAGDHEVELAAVIAFKVREALGSPFQISGHLVEVRASIGIAFFPRHGHTTEDLLRRADAAMHEAKQPGLGLAVFVAEPKDLIARRLTLLSELRDCIPRNELVLHYQPQIDLTTRRTTGVEALVRWRHPVHGFLMPAQFMPEAERDLIEPLTRWVLGEALHQLRRWNDAGLDLTMAVNISARSLGRGSILPDTVAQLIETWGIDPSRLILELTENAIVDAGAPGVLDVLHAMDGRLALDDFGTGHSSLVYLQRLPIDQLKIDRSFVMRLASAPEDAVIVHSTIDLAHNLGLEVVAEGVEDEVALGMLVEYGCDSAQGYYFARPCDADGLGSWLSRSPFGASAGTSLPRSQRRSAGSPT